MKKNIKISLPAYKIIYSILFVILLSFVRGISDADEIGTAMDASMALLAIIFCSDTYFQEYLGNRWEVFVMFQNKQKYQTIVQRMVIQFIYLLVLAMAGYWLFYWQKPSTWGIASHLTLYFWAVFAVTGSIIFFGSLSLTFVNLFRNLWLGIGVSVLTWIMLNSTHGERIPEWINVFAYGSRETTDISGRWVLGKIIAIILSIILILINKKLVCKKGMRIWE